MADHSGVAPSASLLRDEAIHIGNRAVAMLHLRDGGLMTSEQMVEAGHWLYDANRRANEIAAIAAMSFQSDADGWQATYSEASDAISRLDPLCGLGGDYTALKRYIMPRPAQPEPFSLSTTTRDASVEVGVTTQSTSSTGPVSHRADGSPPRRSTSMAWLWWVIAFVIVVVVIGKTMAWLSTGDTCGATQCPDGTPTPNSLVVHWVLIAAAGVAGIVVLFMVCNRFARRFPGATAVFEAGMAAKDFREGHDVRAAINGLGAYQAGQQWASQHSQDQREDQR